MFYASWPLMARELSGYHFCTGTFNSTQHRTC